MMQVVQCTPQFDALLAFADWWSHQIAFMIPPSLHDGTTFIGDFVGQILYRGGAFQVQQWHCKPHSVIPEHSHPNVDTLVVYVSGELYFSKNGIQDITPDKVFPQADGRSSQNLAITRILPTDTHGASIGEKGGCFTVIQYWLNGKPESTEQDWKGEPLCPEHAKMLNDKSAPDP